MRFRETYIAVKKERNSIAMPKTQTACPQCHQPNIVEVQQIFDQGQDPTAKQKLLNGTVNVIQCPTCGYSGMIATPIVYHDPEKELLLTFFPPESNIPLKIGRASCRERV